MNDNKISWSKIVAKYRTPILSVSWWQIINSVIPYILLCVAMSYAMDVSKWLVIGMSLIAAGFLARIFVIFHDCCHRSFFKSKTMNDTVGFILSFFSFTPYSKWRFEHLTHHNTVGNLDERGIGDVETLTVKEYLSLSRWGRFCYRIYRNPIFLFFVAPFLLFVFKNKFYTSAMSKTEKIRLSWNLLYFFAAVAVWVYFFGWYNFLWINIPIIYFGSSVGVWLFYVQHQYEEVVWSRKDEWDLTTVALQGSSYLKLPKLLQWFSGNIGFHHIHHLNPKIPNYKLEKCHYENEEFKAIKPLTFWATFKTWGLALWDEESNRLVGFGELKTLALNY